MQDVYAKITGRIISALEAGVVPWQKPWNTAEGAPRNLLSGKPYRGLNVWLLVHHGGSPFWLTYRQARQIGGYVKKGAKGETVLFWKFKARRVDDEDRLDDDEKATAAPAGYVVARAYTVFNATQCELPEQWAERAKVAGKGEGGADEDESEQSGGHTRRLDREEPGKRIASKVSVSTRSISEDSRGVDEGEEGSGGLIVTRTPDSVIEPVVVVIVTAPLTSTVA